MKMTSQPSHNNIPTVSERKKSLLCHSSPIKKKEKSNPLLNNFSIKPIIQFFNKKLKKDPSKAGGCLKVQRRRKIVIEKDYHSDTYVGVESHEHDENHKTNDRDSGAVGDDGDLEKGVYSTFNKNKRSSLYSDFGDLDIAFVVNEDLYFLDKDEDINFESDTDNDDSGNYEEFRHEHHKHDEVDDEMFAELEAEVHDVTVPTKSAPTVENDDLSQNGDTADEESDDDDDDELDTGSQAVKELSHQGEMLAQETIIVTGSHEDEKSDTGVHEKDDTYIPSNDVNDEVTAGEADPEYKECPVASEQRKSFHELQDSSLPQTTNGHNSNVIKECSRLNDINNDIQEEMSTHANAKDDNKVRDEAKTVTDNLPTDDVHFDLATDKDNSKEISTNKVIACQDSNNESDSHEEEASNIVDCESQVFDTAEIDGNNSHALEVASNIADDTTEESESVDETAAEQDDETRQELVNAAEVDHSEHISPSSQVTTLSQQIHNVPLIILQLFIIANSCKNNICKRYVQIFCLPFAKCSPFLRGLVAKLNSK